MSDSSLNANFEMIHHKCQFYKYALVGNYCFPYYIECSNTICTINIKLFSIFQKNKFYKQPLCIYYIVLIKFDLGSSITKILLKTAYITFKAVSINSN